MRSTARPIQQREQPVLLGLVGHRDHPLLRPVVEPDVGADTGTSASSGRARAGRSGAPTRSAPVGQLPPARVEHRPGAPPPSRGTRSNSTLPPRSISRSRPVEPGRCRARGAGEVLLPRDRRGPVPSSRSTEATASSRCSAQALACSRTSSSGSSTRSGRRVVRRRPPRPAAGRGGGGCSAARRTRIVNAAVCAGRHVGLRDRDGREGERVPDDRGLADPDPARRPGWRSRP